MPKRLDPQLVRDTPRDLARVHALNLFLACREDPSIDPMALALDRYRAFLRDDRIYTKAQLAELFDALICRAKTIAASNKAAERKRVRSMNAPLKSH